MTGFPVKKNIHGMIIEKLDTIGAIDSLMIDGWLKKHDWVVILKNIIGLSFFNQPSIINQWLFWKTSTDDWYWLII